MDDVPAENGEQKDGEAPIPKLSISGPGGQKTRGIPGRFFELSNEMSKIIIPKYAEQTLDRIGPSQGE